MTLMRHYPASTEYVDGATWDVMYCGLRSARTQPSESSVGMAMPDLCPDCAKAKEQPDDAD